MSQYFCHNLTCAIAISKTPISVAMNCPVCQTPLVEYTETLSEADEKLVASLPYVIAYPLKRTLLEKHEWTKINFLKDTFLNYLKYIGLITASEFFNSPLKDKKMVALFQQALSEPSFGSWNQYIRETMLYLKGNNHSFFCEDLVSYYDLVETGKKRKLYKGEIQIIDRNGDVLIKKQEATAIGMLINFRNRYLGHGLTLDESNAINLWETYYPIFRELLKRMDFSERYPMYKCEHGETYLLKSSEISLVERASQSSARVWIENHEGNSMNILPFFVVPGEVSIGKKDKEQLLTYESYTGKSIKFFSPEGTEKQTSGKILDKLNLLLREKQKENPYSPSEFNKELFLARVCEENKLIIDSLISEKKYIPGVYVHRDEIEIKLREWVGARASIFFIAAEAGSGKTNLLVEMHRQYEERGLSNLFIRASRMEKASLYEQFAYLLNVQGGDDLVNYPCLAGTQGAPTIVLIDGINEASKAETLWKEILNLSKMYQPGSLKFIVTCRVNTKGDIERYELFENEIDCLYGDWKDGEEGLGAYVHWLTPLNMTEMKGAWEMYTRKNKNKFKPLFTFNDLALFDRALYNTISNPLVLRLFLETYHGKALPQKKAKHLNVWEDWLNTFSEEELTFLNLLSSEVWMKGENELLLDDLLHNDSLKPYLTSDLINSPYLRLKNNGWISRYFKDFNSYVSFTVEGALFHLLGLKLNQLKNTLTLSDIMVMVEGGGKFKNTIIEVFLSQKALEGSLDFVIELIDQGERYLDVCIHPLLIFMKIHGSRKTLELLLQIESDNDWKLLFKLDATLEKLELHEMKNEFHKVQMTFNSFNTKEKIWLGLRAIENFDKEEAQSHLEIIENLSNYIKSDSILMEVFGDVKKKIGNFNDAILCYQLCLNSFGIGQNEIKQKASVQKKLGEIYLELGYYDDALNIFNECNDLIKENAVFGEFDGIVIEICSNIGTAWIEKGEVDKGQEFLLGALDKGVNILGYEHSVIAVIISNIGVVFSKKDDFDKSIENFEKSLKIQENIFGEWSLELSVTYLNIGNSIAAMGDHKNALNSIQKSLEIKLKYLNEQHPDLAVTYYSIAQQWDGLGEPDCALEYYLKSQEIVLKNFNYNSELNCYLFKAIGGIWKQKEEYDSALENFEKCLEIQINMFGELSIDVFHTYVDIALIRTSQWDHESALIDFEKSIDLGLKLFGINHMFVGYAYRDIAYVYECMEDYDNAFKNYCLYADICSIVDDSFENSINAERKIYDLANHMILIDEPHKALEYYSFCLNLKLNILGDKHPEIAELYFEIGIAQFEAGRQFQNKKDIHSAIEKFKKGYSINRLGGFPYNIALCYEELGEKEKALIFFLESSEIRKEHTDMGIENEATIEAVNNVLRLAKELNKESDLPEWIKNLDL
jgi:tetratricopeptide (TPR) repeat protein